MSRHSYLKYAVPAIGTVYFGGALFLWCVFIFRIVGVEDLLNVPRHNLVWNLGIPFCQCVLLLSGFSSAIYLTKRGSRLAIPVTLGSTLLTGILFVWLATPENAQIHYFGSPEVVQNHFHVNWYVYSWFPMLTTGNRALVATAGVVTAALFLKHSPVACVETHRTMTAE
ncbi:MAG: hypothetical protein R3C18_23090 [Planctomycetaceae bacterium]